MDYETLRQKAEELGFARVYTRKPADIPPWKAHRLNGEVKSDPRRLFCDTRTVIALIRPYAPFKEAAEEGKGVMISAYYLESQAAYTQARTLAEWLRQRGFRALSNQQIAIKPWLEQNGIGRAGRNSLIAIPGLGSFFHVQVILTDAELEERGFEQPMADLCVHCDACARACPTGAIRPGGVIDIDTCLRARGEGEVVPEEMRGLYENRLLGCEICQNVCPRNAGSAAISMPAALSETLALKKLLSGEMGLLPELIGRNYARKTRIRMKAALVAGNLRRGDVQAELEELRQSGDPREQEYARWALTRMEEKQ